MAHIPTKKSVTRLTVKAGRRLVVVTGITLNPDCISINRNPSGMDEYFYVLNQDDVIIRQDDEHNFSAVRVVFDKHRQPTYLAVGVCQYYQEDHIRKAMLGPQQNTLNETNTQLLMQDAMFANIMTHKFTPAGDANADYLYDAPSIIFERVTEKGFDLRAQELHFRVMLENNKFDFVTPRPVMSIQDSKLFDAEDNADVLLASRSLRRPLRLTFRSRNKELLTELETAIINHFKAQGYAWQLTQVKRGNLLLMLPQVSCLTEGD